MAAGDGSGFRSRSIGAIVAKFGEGERSRAIEGVESALLLWRAEDGDDAAFLSFCESHFCPSGPALDALFARFEVNLEEIQGSSLRISKRLQWPIHVETGDLLPVDELLSSWNPQAHLLDDWFANKLAFVLRLNFPRRGLAVKLAKGSLWSRRQWACTRLGEFAADRIPAQVQLDLGAAYARAGNYIAAYNFHLSCLVDDEGPLYAEDKKLLMHWGMRDEIKAQYAAKDGLRRQRALFRAMERVIDGSIPLAVIDGQGFSWNPHSNELVASSASPASARHAGKEAEGGRRYEMMLGLFQAMRGLDIASPDSPSLLIRRFDVDRELPLAAAEALLESLFDGGTYAKAAAQVRAGLGRPLEAFDVWYRLGAGEGRPDEASLDARTTSLFPTAAAFGMAIPRILRALGFAGKEAEWLSARIEVDAAHGSGHAMPAAMRSDKARLRTRVGPGGMDYKGYNIALHELGHNVEQVFSLHGIDEYFLSGVPNNAFTEAFAFVFQARDLEVLGKLDAARPGMAVAERQGTARPEAHGLADYWQTCEIAGVALVDIAVWRWLYAHPDATAAALGGAVLDAARRVWNRLFAPAFGLRDATILGSYSHMIENPLYLADYPIGHVVSFQVEDYLKGRDLGKEMGRMCALGRLTPDEWMRQAVGKELSAAPLVEAARKALG